MTATRFMRAVGLTLLIGAVAPPAVGQDAAWLNGSNVNNQWSNPDNWFLNVPGPADESYFWGLFAGSGPFVVVQDVPTVVQSYLVSDTDATFDGSHLVHSAEHVVVGDFGNPAARFVDGEWNLTTGLYLQQTMPGFVAQMVIESGAILRSSPPGTGFQSPDFDAVAGTGGHSRLEIRDGGRYEAEQLLLGNLGGTADLLVTGAGSHVEMVNPSTTGLFTNFGISAGEGGFGRVTVDQGASLRAQYLVTGNSMHGLTPQDGEILVDGPGSVIELTSSSNPDPILNGIGYLQLAPFADTQGNLTIRNGAQVITEGVLEASQLGSSAIQVQSAGTLQGHGIRLGVLAGGIASANVEGIGSEMRDTFATIVGRFGIGLLNVMDGAHCESPIVGVGYRAGGLGSLTIDGPGSALTVTGDPSGIDLTIGHEGTGEVYVRNSATANVTGHILVGSMPGSTGSLEVQDATVHATRSVTLGGTTIGSGGQGSLRVRDGGALQADEQLFLFSGSTAHVYDNGSITVGPGPVTTTPNTVSVVAGGTLAGGGDVLGNVHVTGGNFAPGGFHEPTVVAGDLNLASGTYRLFVEDSFLYSTLAVDSATISQGMTLDLDISGFYIPTYADVLHVMIAPGTISGCFGATLDRELGTSASGDPLVMAVFYSPDGITLSPRVMGDFNGDGVVSGADFTLWADNFGNLCAGFDQGDANGDGMVTGADFTLWADSFGGFSAFAGDRTVREMEFAAAPSRNLASSTPREWGSSFDRDSPWVTSRRFEGESLAHSVPEPTSALLLTSAISSAFGLLGVRPVRKRCGP